MGIVNGTCNYILSRMEQDRMPFCDALVEALGNRDELRAMGSRAVAVAREMSLQRHLDRLEAIFSANVETYAHSAGR